ncbi:ECF-type sigma factor [Rhodohalobacter barkolensis]|uniref:ECF-type sigma factor n=1 Tax=Rhodohalobacter barkolensis TaxID=2053187 RepID=UPI0023E7C43C|nr:ECF-type sigma factor [Rhodohalobacter barkolensis]
MGNEITQLLHEIRSGSKEAYDKLFSIVYDRLHHIAWREISVESKEHTYSKTDLVHEVYLKLAGQKSLNLKNRRHFFAITSRAMRQILIDYARTRDRKKRGGKMQPITYIDELMKVDDEAKELLEIDEALNRLSQLDERLAEIVEMHYFGEMSFDDIADVLDLSSRTVYRDWAKARAWLYKELKRNK